MVATGPITVLLVEDEADDVLAARIAFERLKLEARLVVAGDGQAALDFLLGPQALGGKDGGPLFVLLDWKLPKVTGLEVLRRLRSHPRGREVFVMVFTSSSLEQDRLRAYAAGANLFETKPVSYESFEAIMRRVKSLVDELRDGQ